MHRKISAIGFGYYEDSRQPVGRVYLLVIFSRRTINSLDWAASPSMNTLFCSYLLACASDYTEKPSGPWLPMNESLQLSRNSKIWKDRGTKDSLLLELRYAEDFSGFYTLFKLGNPDIVLLKTDWRLLT